MKQTILINIEDYNYILWPNNVQNPCHQTAESLGIW